LAAQDKLPAAVEAASKAFEVEPRDLNALMLRAQLNMQQDKLEPALADLNRILQARPGAPQALLLRSGVFVDQKKYVEAIRDLRELARMNPENELIRLQAAQVYVAGGWPRFAIQILGGLIASSPDNASALRSRGDAYLNIGRHAEAIADFDKALALDPNNSGVLNNLAWVLATSPDDKVRNPERSIKLATKACEVTDYKAAHILSTLASGFAEKGDFETAIKWSTKAVELSQGESKEQLKKELESYQQKKPWRERQETADKPNPPPLDEGQEL
jgi:tetratricopeptide (TPR) repeat protein